MTKSTKIFNFFRIVAFAAMLCTLAVTVFMLVQSAASAEKSSALSSMFSGENGGEIVVAGRGDEVPTQGLALKYDMDCSGATVKPNITFIPAESTDRELIWEVTSIDNVGMAEACATLDVETGELEYHHFGHINVKASLKSDPTIFAICNATCLGTEPSKITSLTPTRSTFKQGENAPIRMKDQNGELVAFIMFNVSYSDGGEHFTQASNFVTAKKPGTTTVTVSHPNMAQEFSFDITVVENPNYIPLEKFEPKASASVVPDEQGQTYFVKPNVTTDIRTLFGCLPSGSSAFQTYSFSLKNPAGKKVLEKTGTFLFRTNAIGEAKLTITSRMDPTVSITFNVCVYVDKPTTLKILISDIIIVDRLYSIRTMGNEFYTDNVTYEVLKGKATFDGAKFRPTRLGKLVIRATYDDDPTLYTDITLDVKLFDTFSSFVRKALGHFLLFAVLGFGFSFVYLFLFDKRLKWVAAPLALPTGLLLAMASEGLQLTAEGRYASWTDVGVDFVGFALGIAAAWLLLGAAFLLAAAFKKYRVLRDGFDKVDARTLFVPAKKAVGDANDVDASNKTADMDEPCCCADIASDEEAAKDNIEDAESANENHSEQK